MYTLVENDTGIELKVTCTEGDDATLIDLTDCTVLLRWTSFQSVVEKPMTVLDAANGLVSYVFGTGDITAPDMEFEIQITNLAGETRTSLQTFRERVRERL